MTAPETRATMNRTAGTPSTNGPSSSVPCRSTSHWVGLARSLPPKGALRRVSTALGALSLDATGAATARADGENRTVTCPSYYPYKSN